MIASELKRYFKSKLNIINVIICSIPVLISYYFTNIEKNEQYSLIVNPSSDYNLSAGKAIYEGINGFTYLFDFLFSSDLYIIFVLMLSLAFGAILGGVELRNREKGFGNMIFTRSGIKRGTYQIILAQILYIAIYIIVYFMLLTVITLVIYPVNSNIQFTLPFPLETSSAAVCIILISEHILKLLIYMITIVIITYGASCFINNKYVISVVPLMVYFIPLFACSLIGNVVTTVGEFITHFIPDVYLLSIYNRYATGIVNIGDEFFLPISLLALAFIIICAYNEKTKRNYL